MPHAAGERVLASSLNLGNVIPATPVSTTSLGTATSGTTETLDSVLGTYQFSAVSGQRYQVFLNGLHGNGNVVADLFEVRIRDSGSASAPTTGSTLIAAAGWYCAATGGPGRTLIPVSETFVSGSTGTHTLGVFAVRLAGTGIFTPASPAGGTGRELYVVSLGTV